MSISVNNTQTLNLNTQFNCNNRVAFKAASKQASSSKTASDTVEISTKKKGLSKEAKWGIGAIAASVIGIVYGIKKFQVKNIKNIQKAFQESFMRDDITIEETREILKRYKEIEKITDDKEYAKAIFKEAKKNFGLEKSNIELFFKDKKGANGFCDRTNREIYITPNCSRSHMMNTIHHEFRHAKQHNAIYNLYPEEYLGARVLVDSYAEKMIDKNIRLEDIDIEELWAKALKEFKEKGIDLTDKDNITKMEWCKKPFEKYFVKEDIPDKYKDWVEKCKDGARNYVNPDKNFVDYWNNFTEIDARRTGRKMNKYIKSKAFTPSDWASDIQMKLRTFFAHKENS